MKLLTDVRRSASAEFVRLRRLWKLAALTVGLSVVATALTYSGSGTGQRSSGVSTSTDQLVASDGIVAWLDLAGNFIGLLSLVLWALSVARDVQSGSIRVLLVSLPRRGPYLVGKVAALVLGTAATVMSSVAVCIAVAFAAATANDVSTAGWRWTNIATALFNAAIAAIAWGACGAALAMVTRSSAAAIAGGIGYMLLGENLVATVWSDAGRWLPSGVFRAVTAGGTTDVAYARAILFTLGYAALAAAITAIVLERRDITD